jgi:hypothetical protein
MEGCRKVTKMVVVLLSALDLKAPDYKLQVTFSNQQSEVEPRS